ncbi:MAG TPA: hemin uptake protein HemP [Candidatus Binatia bacterium]|jgi:hemin uptake protein HemP
MKEIIFSHVAKPSDTTNGSSPTSRKPRIESHHLFQGNSEIVIVHQNEEYSLRITRNGKLILTK